MSRLRGLFTTVRTEGGLLPPDVLGRIGAVDKELGGLTLEAYHLGPSERFGETATRAWNRLIGAWQAFRTAAGKLPSSDPGTTVTRERWLLVLFQEFGYGRLPVSRREDKRLEAGGKSYAISHLWQSVPIHLVGFRVDLDRRVAGVAGASRTSPHGLTQEFLNAGDGYLWGIVSNGLRLRILRDNASLTRQAYVEFDLEAMMEGEVYADFVLLWLLLHESRLEAQRPEDCWLEKWMRAARDQGTRALETLRGGVEEAIGALGRGLLGHPGNGALRDRLRSGALTTQDYYRQLLRLVYRLIFLFVAEDRELLFGPETLPKARDRYLRFYSAGGLRRLAARRRGTPHGDLFEGLKVVTDHLADGCPDLALPALDSYLWAEEAIPDLASAKLANSDLLSAIRALCLTTQDRIVRTVDYRNLGSEELGSIYESLLELHPELNLEGATFELGVASGHERKTTGSYYTPSSLVQCLLDSALDPVLDEAAAKPDAERAILALKVCDPACGSGHFLIAAAHRIARRLAAVRTGDEEPSPEATRGALRDVIGHCLYGVDVNPMAVELCKVSLWMEALEPGKPFTYLESRILCGNSLIGATPALMAKGIPDEAFAPIEGDDRNLCSTLRRQNAKERRGDVWLYPGFVAETGAAYNVLTSGMIGLDDIPDDSLPGLRRKEEAHQRLIGSPEYLNARLAADAWCAAFVWKKAARNPCPITSDFYRRLRDKPQAVAAPIRTEIARLAEEYGFLHWHLAFPDVFSLPAEGEAENAQAGWNGGFDVVLGNPPWERVKIQEKEWFAGRRPDIAAAPNAAARRKLISALAEEDPALHEEFLSALRRAEGESHLIRDSGRFPLCGRGDVNTYSVFAETMRLLTSPASRVGAIVPSGIATDDTTKFFFQDLMDTKSLVSLYDFENQQRQFPSVHRSYKFCLLTLAGTRQPAEAGAEFAFFVHQTDDLKEPDRRFGLSAADIRLLNPNTQTCPVFRTRRDAEITMGIYERVPVLIREGDPAGNPWGLSFLRMLDMSNDSHLFRTRRQLEAEGWALEGNVFIREETGPGSTSQTIPRYLPLYEAKMIDLFDHRASDIVISKTAAIRQGQPENLSIAGHEDPNRLPCPRYWVSEDAVLASIPPGYQRTWLQGFADVTSATNERTAIATLIPAVGAGNNLQLVLLPETWPGPQAAAFLAGWASFAFDYLCRQKLGGVHCNYFIIKQVPVIPPSAFAASCPWNASSSVAAWIAQRVLELVYTAWDLRPFALDCGYDGPPFRWNEERRIQLRCELDAAYFHLYGITREDAHYILDTFPITRRRDEALHGEYRTKRMILECYDAMRVAADTRHPYRTNIDPPPGDPSAAHSA
jgi:hypothetical protein